MTRGPRIPHRKAAILGAALLAAVTGGAIASGATEGSLSSQSVGVRSLTVAAAADTYVSESHPDRLHGDWTWLATCPTTCGQEVRAARRALVTFRLADLPADATDVHATLQLRSLRSGTAEVSVHQASPSWSEATATWLDQPSAGPEVASRATISGTGYDGWDVSAKVTTNGIYSFRVDQASGPQMIFVSSEDSRGQGPRLVVSYREGAGGTSSTPAGSTAPVAATTAPSSAAPAPPSAGTINPTSTTTAPSAGGGPSASSAPLPFDLPSKVTLRSSPHKVFAHYFTPYPISLDNKPPDSDYYAQEYLDPHGENDKFLQYGGLLRERPLPRAPLDGDWQLKDMQTEVRRASAAGLDGFTVDLLSLSGYNWDRTKLLIKAAESVDSSFKIILMPDMTTLSDDGPAALVRAVTELSGSPSMYRLGDGRMVLSPFYAEKQTASWWKDVLGQLRSNGVDVAFVPCFLSWRANASSFASISYGFSDWGSRSPAANDNVESNALDAHSQGKIWMQPVAPQDVRPRSAIYDEANNTENFRVTWEGAIAGADWVQLPTWNDYSESAEVAPSTHISWTFLDLTSYYLTKFKTGSAPKLVRDVAYLTHRVQFVDAKPSLQTTLMSLRSGSSPARDAVEVLTFLTAPANVHVTVGSNSYDYTAAAGVQAKIFPLATGTVSVSLSRDGTALDSVTSPFPVTGSIQVQDLAYHAVSTAR
jgi:Glycosyl hydrolase family 71